METQPTDPYATLGVPRTATQPEIRKAYLKLVREHPPEADPEAFARINDAYAVLGNAEKRAAFDAAPVWPADALEAAKEAVAAAHAERFDDACRLLEPVVAKHPGFEPLERLYAQSLLGAERYADALPIWRRVVEAHPADVGALYMLGVAVGAGGKGDMEEAVRLLKRAITLAPDDPECAIGLGRTYLRMGRAEDAATAFARGMDRHPEPGPERLAFRVEILRGARLLPGSADADAARARLKNDLASVDDPVRQHALSRLWRVARDFRREGRLDVAAALFDDFADVGPPESRAAEAAETLRAYADYRADLARLRADASQPRWLKEMAEAFDLDRDDRTRRAFMTRFAKALARSERESDRAQKDFASAAESYEHLCARLVDPLSDATFAACFYRTRPDLATMFLDPDVADWLKNLAVVEVAGAAVPDRAGRNGMLQAYVREHPAAAQAEFAAAGRNHPSAIASLRNAFEFLRRGSARAVPVRRPGRQLTPPTKLAIAIGLFCLLARIANVAYFTFKGDDRQTEIYRARLRRIDEENERLRQEQHPQPRRDPTTPAAADGR